MWQISYRIQCTSYIRYGIPWFVYASFYIMYYILYVFYCIYIYCIQYVRFIAALCGTMYTMCYMFYVFVACIVCVMYAMDGVIYVIYSILDLVYSISIICYIVSILYMIYHILYIVQYTSYITCHEYYVNDILGIPCSIVYIEYILYSLYYIIIAIISYLQLHYIYLYNICYILYLSGSRGTWYLGGMAELSISTTDDDTCGDLCKYRCGNCQGSLVGLQITAYAIGEGGQRHQSLSLSLRPSSVSHFQFSMLPGTIEMNATSPS